MFRRALRTASAAACIASALLASSLSAGAEEVAMVTTRVIYPGETVVADVLKQVKLKAGRQVPPAMATVLAEIDGKVAKRTLLPGRYIPLASVRNAYLLEQGVPVQVVFEHGGLIISASAITLQPGSPGDLVKVRNVDSGAVFFGTVMADGTIKVGAS